MNGVKGIEARPSDKPVNPRDRAEIRAVLQRAIEQVERRQMRVRVPREEGLMEKHKGMHFHYRPEVFIQLVGRTEFRFPKESFALREEEICIIPSALPHGETARPGLDGRAFRNLVAGFYDHTLSLHFAHEVEPAKPDIDCIEFIGAPNLDTFVTVATSVVKTYHMHAPARDQVLKGFVVALLGMFENLVATDAGNLNAELGKVFQVKWIVREQFSNPDLNVKTIAERLHCSPDYLSHLFHTETGEKLIQYIQRTRINGAMQVLETTPLNISEIAYASGFSDPAYFARVFKKHKGETPQEFRARLEEQRRAREAHPKTIYYDREDYTFGTPVPPRPPDSAPDGGTDT
ncbi:MAG TPA: helix-turn-helix transcriptional regulator [Opitutaceae bacterium]